MDQATPSSGPLASSLARALSLAIFECNSRPINLLALYIKSCRERSVHFLPLRLLLRLLVTVIPRRAIHARDRGRASSYPSRRFLPHRLLLSPFSSSLIAASFFLLHGTTGYAILLVQHQTNGDSSRLCPPSRSLAIRGDERRRIPPDAPGETSRRSPADRGSIDNTLVNQLASSTVNNNTCSRV